MGVWSSHGVLARASNSLLFIASVKESFGRDLILEMPAPAYASQMTVLLTFLQPRSGGLLHTTSFMKAIPTLEKKERKPRGPDLHSLYSVPLPSSASTHPTNWETDYTRPHLGKEDEWKRKEIRIPINSREPYDHSSPRKNHPFDTEKPSGCESRECIWWSAIRLFFLDGCLADLGSFFLVTLTSRLYPSVETWWKRKRLFIVE